MSVHLLLICPQGFRPNWPWDIWTPWRHPPMVPTTESDAPIPLLGPKTLACPLSSQSASLTCPLYPMGQKVPPWSHKPTAHCIIGREWCFSVQVIRTVDKAFYLIGKAPKGMGLTCEIKLSRSWWAHQWLVRPGKEAGNLPDLKSQFLCSLRH